MPELAYVNGVFGPISEAKVSIDDRGFQFGDGIYEVIVAYNGKPFLMDRHLDRFRHSADGIRLEYDFVGRPLAAIIEEGIRRAGFADTMVYIQITRGVAPRVHAIPAGMCPTVIMTFKALPVVPDSLRERGASAMTARDIRWANCYIKAITLLPNILAKSEAVRLGFDDAIFVADDGEVRECTSANIFLVRAGELYFPPRNASVLHGITQSFIMECAAGIGMPIREERIDLMTLRKADEVFLSSTLQEVLGITTIDKRPVGEGAVGPFTRKLFAEFRRRSRGESLAGGCCAAAHPEQTTREIRGTVCA